MKAVAPAKKATPARQPPPCSNAFSKSSKATPVISAPGAKRSRPAVAARGGGIQIAIKAPGGSALDATTAKRIASPIDRDCGGRVGRRGGVPLSMELGRG